MKFYAYQTFSGTVEPFYVNDRPYLLAFDVKWRRVYLDAWPDLIFGNSSYDKSVPRYDFIEVRLPEEVNI